MNYWHYVEKVISNQAGQVNMSELMKEMQEYIDRYRIFWIFTDRIVKLIMMLRECPAMK